MEEAFEGATVVNNDEAAEPDFEKNVLDEEPGKIMCGDVIRGGDQNEAGQVAHSVHEVGFTAVVGDFTGGPEVDMQDIKGAAERPRENKLTVAGNRSISGDAVRALEAPVCDVLAAARPKEAEADAMEGFVDTHVAGRGGRMVSGEYVAAKGRRDNDEH